MTFDRWMQLGAFFIASATFLLNMADFRHRTTVRRPTPPPPVARPMTLPTTARVPAARPIPPPPPGARAPVATRRTMPVPPPPLAAAPPPRRPVLAWSLSRRITSHLIDWYAPLIPLWAASGLLDETGTPRPGHEGAYTLAVIITFGAYALNALASATTGRTLGRLLLGGRLVDRVTGAPIGLSRMVVHSASLIALIALPALGAFRGPARQGFHDDWTRAWFVDATAG